jgi:hypothetical protein
MVSPQTETAVEPISRADKNSLGNRSMTLEAVRKMLLQKTKQHAIYAGSSGLKGWCREYGVTHSHASEFVKGKKKPGSDLLEALGLEWRVMRKLPQNT